MSDQLDKKSILEMSMGAILERVDYEMGKVMDNILDPNTKATAKRKISVTLELIPSADRRTITVQSTAKCSLTPTHPAPASCWWPKWCPRSPASWPSTVRSRTTPKF